MATLDLSIMFIDEKRDVTLWGVQVEEDQPVLRLHDILAEQRPYLAEEAMFFYNQSVQVEELETPVKEVFKSGDTVVACIETAPPADMKDKGWGGRKQIDNRSGVEVMVTLRQFGGKVSFPGDRLHSINFNKWSKKIEVYWATGEHEGETVYKGNVYELDEPGRVWEYQILADGLYWVESGDRTPRKINPRKEGKEKYERDFLNPRETTFPFKNSGNEPLRVISGSKINFEVSPPIDPGSTLRYRIKGNKFGLIPAETSSQEGGSSGSRSSRRTYHATMFDSRAPAHVVVFNVKKSSQTFEASYVSTNGREHSLENSETKTYRESELITLKCKLGMAVEIISTATSIASTLVECVK